MASDPLADANLLDITPVPTCSWREADGRIVLERPKPMERGFRGVLERLSHRMSVPRVRLDDLGSVTWRHLDGRRTVADVCTAVRADFEGDPEPLEQRMGIFLGHLRKAGFVAYAGWDDEAIAHWQERQARETGPQEAAAPSRGG